MFNIFIQFFKGLFNNKYLLQKNIDILEITEELCDNRSIKALLLQ